MYNLECTSWCPRFSATIALGKWCSNLWLKVSYHIDFFVCLFSWSQHLIFGFPWPLVFFSNIFPLNSGCVPSEAAPNEKTSVFQPILQPHVSLDDVGPTRHLLWYSFVHTSSSSLSIYIKTKWTTIFQLELQRDYHPKYCRFLLQDQHRPQRPTVACSSFTSRRFKNGNPFAFNSSSYQANSQNAGRFFKSKVQYSQRTYCSLCGGNPNKEICGSNFLFEPSFFSKPTKKGRGRVWIQSSNGWSDNSLQRRDLPWSHF